MTKQRTLFVALAVIFVLVVGLVAAYLTPPFFVQAGNHYFGGSNLLSVGGIYRCDVPQDPNCEPVRETLVAAIANDPVMANWLPVRAEFLRFD